MDIWRYNPQNFRQIKGLEMSFTLKMRLCVLLACSLLLFAGFANAATPSFDDWVERLKKQALSQGISQQTIDQAFLAITQTSHQATFTPQKTNQFLDQYLAITQNPQQINYEKKLLQHYNNVLFEISHLFGVEPEVLIAIWTLDNLEQKDKQTFNAIELLVSTSFQQPKNKMVLSELMNALRLIDDKQVNPAQFTSDENGLLGTVFFKPSTLRNYGIDYDGDGVIDIWNNYADIFASAANYLSSIGWESKKKWGMEILAPQTLAPEATNINTQRSINYWHSQGIRLADGTDLPLDGSLGSLIKPGEFSERLFLVMDNYFALLRWKRSHHFALSVGLTVNKLQPETSAEPATPFLGAN